MTTPAQYLADTTALIRLDQPDVAAVLAPLLQAGSVATCGVVDLDLLGRVHDPTTLVDVRRARAAAFLWLPTHDDDLRRALDVQAELVTAGHAVPWPTLVVAAVAERHALPTLHYDQAFDRIARVSGQPTLWVVPEGSLP